MHDPITYGLNSLVFDEVKPWFHRTVCRYSLLEDNFDDVVSKLLFPATAINELPLESTAITLLPTQNYRTFF